MPRRSNLQVAIQLPPTPEPDQSYTNLAELRKQWRWAAFSQFFFTFSPLFAMNDVTIADVERDLTCNSKLVIPRIMQRLLYTLSYDRKVSVDNWQTALRKQYYKRDPAANPIGPEPPSSFDILDEAETVEESQAGNNPQVVESTGDLTTQEASQPPALSDNSLSAPPSPPQQDVGSESASQPLDTHSTRQSSVVDHLPPVKSLDEDEQQPSLDWFDLPMLSKLESLHTLSEWQFQNPTRLRMIMKSDDETASWRVEPIGYDSKRNAYWFIGTDRLWIQRVPPKPPKSKNLKRKRPASKSPAKKRTSAAVSKGAKRPRLAPSHSKAKQPAVSTPSSGRHSRAAKDQAKIKLDAQAKELAELNRQAALATPTNRSVRQGSLRSQAALTPPRPLGTRASARIRGTNDEEEWQQVPDGWLDERPSLKSSRNSSRLAVKKTGLESDDGSVSDLTELSEEVPEPSISEDEQEEEPEPELESYQVPEDFIEWETICASLYEWDHVAERFEKATHYAEKALYKVLVNDVVPYVTQELREIERKRQIEEAMVHRKRSSRLAIRESEKEAAKQEVVKKREDDEKMSRARRLELRQQREEEERLKREKEREERRIQREAREEARKAQIAAEEAEAEAKAKAEAEKAERAAKKLKRSNSPAREPRKPRSQRKKTADVSSVGSSTPAKEDWELACEICGRNGINLDDGTPMMSCGICSRWQHIQCHDRADREAGRPRRNWKSEDFICARCRATQRMHYNSHPSLAPRQTAPTQKSLPSINVPPTQVYGTYPTNGMLGYPAYASPNGRVPVPQPSSYRESYYSRPNGQQAPQQYPPNSSSSSSMPFNHYQPAQQNFMPTTGAQRSIYTPSQNAHARGSDPPVQQYTSYRQDSNPAYYRSQPAAASTWNGTSDQSPGYSLAQGIQSVMTAPSHRHMQTVEGSNPPTNGHSHPYEPQTSYARYPTTEPYPPSSQHKQPSLSHQSSAER